jgi:hypothetical protein
MVDPTHLDENDTRTAPQARADALTTFCDDYLTHHNTRTRGGTKPHVVVNVSVTALHGEPEGPCELDGTVITTETARRYACDPAITAIFWDGDTIVGVGRSTRRIPPRLRLALDIRDGGCTWKGCEMPARFCDGHHIIHWIDGGETELDNLRLLCRRHHRKIHLAEGADPEEPRSTWDAEPGTESLVATVAIGRLATG